MYVLYENTKLNLPFRRLQDTWAHIFRNWGKKIHLYLLENMVCYSLYNICDIIAQTDCFSREEQPFLVIIPSSIATKRIPNKSWIPYWNACHRLRICFWGTCYVTIPNVSWWCCTKYTSPNMEFLETLNLLLSCLWIWLVTEPQCGLCLERWSAPFLSFENDIKFMSQHPAVHLKVFSSLCPAEFMPTLFCHCGEQHAIKNVTIQSPAGKTKHVKVNTRCNEGSDSHLRRCFCSPNIHTKLTVDSSAIANQWGDCKTTFLYDVVGKWMQLFQESGL